jgi:hypothetical protein
MRQIQIGINLTGADQAKRDLRDISSAEQQVTSSAEKLASAQTKVEQSTQALGKAQQQTTQQLKNVIVEADGTITRFTKLDQVMQRLDDRSLRKLEAGTISVDQAVKQLQADADKAAAAIGRQGASAEKSSGLMGGLVNAWTLFGVAAVAGAKSTLNYADNLDTMAQRAGMGVEAFQRISYAAKQNNVEMGALTGAINLMQDRIAGRDKSAVGALQLLGLSFDTFRRMAPEEQLLAVSDAIKGVADHDEQIKILNDLFGKQGKELLPLIASNMREVMGAAHVMSDEAVKGLANANDELDTLKNSLTVLAGQLLTLTRAPWIIHVVSQMAGTASDVMGGNFETMQRNFNIGWNAADWWMKPFAGAASALTGAGDEGMRQVFGGGGGAGGNGAGVPGSFIEGSPWGEGNTLGDYLAAQKKKGSGTGGRSTSKPASWTDLLMAQGFAAMDGPMTRWGAPVRGWTPDMENGAPGSIIDWNALMRSQALAAMPKPEGTPYGAAIGLDAEMKREAAYVKGPGLFSSTLSSITSSLPNAILGALMGGGSVGQAAGGSIGNAIFGKQGLGGKISDGLASIFGSSGVGGAIGGALGSIVPGLGTLLGSGLGSLFGKIFGPSQGKKDAMAAEQSINQLQSQLLAQYGGMANLKQLGQEAGVDITAAWGDKNVKGLAHFQQSAQDFQAAVQAQAQLKDMQKSLVDTYGSMDQLKSIAGILGVSLDGAFGPDAKGVQGLKTMQDVMGQIGAKQDALNGAIGKYGLTLDDLGPKYQAFTVKTEMKSLLDDWNSLIGAGADENAVLTKMAGSWSGVAEEAMKYGTQLDPALQPILQKLSDMGLLLDDQKNKIDLSKLAFAAPDDSLLTAATNTLDTIKGRINDFPKLINVNFQADQTGDWPDPNNYDGSHSGPNGDGPPDRSGAPYARGGLVGRHGPLYFSRGGWVPRGTDIVPAMLTPGEIVINRDDARRVRDLVVNGGSSRPQTILIQLDGKVIAKAAGKNLPDFLKVRGISN